MQNLFRYPNSPHLSVSPSRRRVVNYRGANHGCDLVRLEVHEGLWRHVDMHSCMLTQPVGAIVSPKGDLCFESGGLAHATNRAPIPCPTALFGFTFYPQELPVDLVLALRRYAARGRTWKRQWYRTGTIRHHPGTTPSDLPLYTTVVGLTTGAHMGS